MNHRVSGHELECPIHDDKEYPPYCACDALRAAYQRGREDAAQEILMEPTVAMFDEEHPNGDFWMRRNDAYAAARGDGEQA